MIVIALELLNAFKLNAQPVMQLITRVLLKVNHANMIVDVLVAMFALKDFVKPMEVLFSFNKINQKDYKEIIDLNTKLFDLHYLFF